MAIQTLPLTDKNVTTAGTRVQLQSTNQYVFDLIIQAKPANTGSIYVGDSTVTSTKCIELLPGQIYSMAGAVKPNSLEELNIADYWIDSSVNGEGVHLSYQQRRA